MGNLGSKRTFDPILRRQRGDFQEMRDLPTQADKRS